MHECLKGQADIWTVLWAVESGGGYVWVNIVIGTHLLFLGGEGLGAGEASWVVLFYSGPLQSWLT